WADSAVAVDDGYFFGRTMAGYVAVERGRYTDATSQLEAASRQSSDVETANVLGARAMVEAREGAMQRARATLHQADSIVAQLSEIKAHTVVYISHGYVAIVQTDKALKLLERYSPVEDLHFQTHLRCDPPLDPI